MCMVINNNVVSVHTVMITTRYGGFPPDNII